MDFSMPGGGPLLVKAARELHPELHIIVFSGRQDARTRDAMLDAGANQYVVKTGRLRPLIEALDRAFIRYPACCPDSRAGLRSLSRPAQAGTATGSGG